MTDKLSVARRSENMRRIKSTGMKPELAVRRLIHSMGYRFRLHRKDLPGKPDLVFSRLQKAIFIHGCFWHQLLHPTPLCKDARLPKSNLEYWVPKLERNKDRDSRSEKELQKLGWNVLVIWQCEVESAATDTLDRKILRFLKSTKNRP